MIPPSELTSPQSCSLIRRLAAIFYDSLLLFAILFIATAVLIPFTGGLAISSENLLYFPYLSICSYLFFTWQWTHGGQTLGMRAWKIKVFNMQSGPVSSQMARMRFVLAAMSWLFAGAGFLWCIFDADKLCFHDRYSGTKLCKVNNN
jgi:uncharacterized RDD family membrane protein YckC